jgi:hypothetical protein
MLGDEKYECFYSHYNRALEKGSQKTKSKEFLKKNKQKGRKIGKAESFSKKRLQTIY